MKKSKRTGSEQSDVWKGFSKIETTLQDDTIVVKNMSCKQKIDSVSVAGNAKADGSESSTAEEEGEVIDPSCEGVAGSTNDEVIEPPCEGAANSTKVESKSINNESDEESGVSSELTETEPGDIEDQSPEVSTRGSSKSRAKKDNIKLQKSNSVSAPTRRSPRLDRR